MFRAILSGVLLTLLAGVATVPEASAQTDFTFRRVKVPEPGAKRLITIQVEPVAPVKPVLDNIPDVPSLPALPEASRAPGVGSRETWFWSVMSPALADARGGKLARAIGVLEGRAADAARLAPGNGRIRGIAETYGAEILRATAGTGVSPALVLSVIAVESNGSRTAKSSAGAVGLMQLMPATAKRFGVSDRTDPAQNIRGGVQYLDFLLETFAGDALLALAAYNAGEGAVTESGGVPDYAETRAYVPKVVAAWREARLLCLTPPVRASDGCLFAGLRLARQ